MSYRCNVVGCLRKTDGKHLLCNMCREDPEKRKARAREAQRRHRKKHGVRRGQLGPRRPCECGSPPFCRGLCRKCYDKHRETLRPELRAKRLAYLRAKADADRDSARAATQAWREKNRQRDRDNATRRRREQPDNVRALRLLYTATSPKYRESVAKRRAYKRGAYGTVTHQEWAELVGLYEGVCPRCKRAWKKPTLDHIVPISKGGLHYIWNVQPLCHSCNCSKSKNSEGFYPPPCYAR